MAFHSSFVWLCVQHGEGILGVRLIGPLLFSGCKKREKKNDTHGNPHILNFLLSTVMWSSYTSPLKASSSWPRVNIPWRPWSPAPCSRRWWSFHLHAFCWAPLPSCVFQIWVRTQAHDMMCRSDRYLTCIRQKAVTFISTFFYFDCRDCFLIDSFSAQMFLRWKSWSHTVNHHAVWEHINQHSEKFRWFILARNTKIIKKTEQRKRGGKGGTGRSWLALSDSRFFSLPCHGGIRCRQDDRASGAAGGGWGGRGGEQRRDSLLSSDLSKFEPVDKVFDCLVLQVGAHIAGEGPIGVTLFGHSKDAVGQNISQSSSFNQVLHITALCEIRDY